MENLNEKRKAGRPKKTESPVEIVKEEASKPEILGVVQQTSVEAKKVELGISRDRMSAVLNKDEYLAKYILPKYLDKKVAWVDRREASERWRGWRFLKWMQATDSLIETESIDEADKTHSNVLCWRDKHIQDAIDNEWKKKQTDQNRKVLSENYRVQAEAMNNSLKTISPGIGAKPLDEQLD